jgi:hypothetical protein
MIRTIVILLIALGGGALGVFIFKRRLKRKGKDVDEFENRKNAILVFGFVTFVAFFVLRIFAPETYSLAALQVASQELMATIIAISAGALAGYSVLRADEYFHPDDYRPNYWRPTDTVMSMTIAAFIVVAGITWLVIMQWPRECAPGQHATPTKYCLEPNDDDD